MLRFSYGLRRHVGQNTCTEILSWSERFVSIRETSWIILQIEKGSVFQPAFWFASGTGNIGIASSAAAIYDNKCRPILFGELHWVTPILFCFVLASLNSRPSLRHAQIQIFMLPLCSGLYSVTVSLVFPSQFLLQIKWLKHTGVLKQASNEVQPAMLKMRIIFFLKKWIITLKY